MSKAGTIWKMTIRKKLMLISLVLLLAPVAILGAVSYKVSARENNAQIEDNLRNSVKMAIELIGSFDDAVKKGVMTKEDAQERVRQLLLGPKQDGARSVNKHIDLGPNGYFFAITPSGDLTMHPSLEGQNIIDKKTSDGFYYIKDLIQKGQNGGGFTIYNWPLPNSAKEAEKITYSELAPQWGWIICAGSYMQDYTAGQRRILHAIIITLIGCWLVGGLAMTLFALHISRPIRKLAAQAKKIATGDLRSADLTVKNRDEIGELAVSFESMYQNLRRLAGSLLSSSDSLSAASQELSVSIGETTKATVTISNSIHEMATANETQARSIQESANAMEEMASGIQRIAQTSATAHEASVRTLREAEQGNQLIVQSSEQMNAVSSTVGDLAAIVAKLGERSQQIGEIVQAITEISSQTNLLALNASIEAARAGEHGKGFAVVAGEVRKLAERSNASAAQVTELVEAIQSDIEQAATAMVKGEQEVDAGVQAIRRTGEAFASILEATRSVVDQVQEASAVSEQMSASSQQIAASLQEMERMSSQSNEMSQAISASTEEQLASMEEISASAESLSGMSKEMQELAHRFKL
jgi:methyl-accepting chemotaxis protein